MAINIISRQITLDVYRHDKASVTVNAIAADNDTRYVAAEIQNDGVRYDISSSATVELMVLRPDKVGVSIVGQPQELTYETDPVFDPDTGETTPGETLTYYGVYAELDQAALAKSGTLLGQFKIISGNQVLRTELFKINNGRALDAETSDWSGEYQGYNLDELVQIVNTASASVTAMQTDLSVVSEDVGQLSDLSYAIPNESIPASWFERGSITSGNNDSYRSGSRCRSKNILKFSYAVCVTVTQGQFIIFYYNDNDEWVSPHSGWKTSADKIFIPANTPFRIMASLNNSAPATQTDALVDMVKAVVFKADERQDHVVDLLTIPFEHGAIASGIDDTYNQAGRARSPICKLPFSAMVSMKNYSYVVAFFDDNKNFVNTTTWRTTNKYLIPANTFFRMSLAKAPTSAAYAELGEMVSDLVIEPIRSTAVYSPNVIFQSRNVDDSHIPPESKWYVKAASKNQYDRVRFTVRVTTDGYLFCCHDDNINNVARNTDGTVISNTVAANGRTLAELNTYDWGIAYGAAYAGTNVPLLADGLKYAALYNMGVTFHSATSLVETDSEVAKILTLFDKYGLTDNMIVITSDGHNFETMAKFKAHNPRISYYIGGDESFFTDSANIESIKALKTGLNRIYVQLYPWGTAPTSAFITIAKTNGFELYDSITMSEGDLLNVESFSKGYTLREVNNVRMIRDTISYWADGLIT